jgi:indolepyruvate ferredoxin oxidoreductase
MQIGAWVRPLLHLMAALRGLRGSWLDPFARSNERRAERAWIERYRQAVDEVLGGLNRENLSLALRIARVPQDIRGFGHIKQAAMGAAERDLQALLAQWRGGPPAPTPTPPLPESVTMPAELQQQ